VQQEPGFYGTAWQSGRTLTYQLIRRSADTWMIGEQAAGLKSKKIDSVTFLSFFLKGRKTRKNAGILADEPKG
jgi:hypothetical protein